MATSSLKIRKVESIVDELEKIHDQVRQRAYEIFERSVVSFGHEINWLAAESELTWKPPIELTEKDGRFLVKAAVAGVDAKKIDVRVTPDDLLIYAAGRHEHREDVGSVHICEFSSGTLFRPVRLPKRINPDKVQAELKNGMLRLTAEIENPEPGRKVEVRPSNPPRAPKRRRRQPGTRSSPHSKLKS